MSENKVKIKNTKTMSEEKKFFWISKVLFLFTAIAAISNIILFFVATNLVPNIKVQPFFIESKNLAEKDILVYKDYRKDLSRRNVKNEQEFYKIKPNSASFKIAENNIKKYIIDRETIVRDTESMFNNWGNESDVFYFSSEEIYKKFSETKTFRSVIEQQRDLGWNKIVEIKELKFHSRANEWIADVIFRYIQPNGMPFKTLEKRIVLEVGFNLNELKRNKDNMYKNPLGFTVEKYFYTSVNKAP
ncbi:MAG: type IV secretion system protein [Alphaproteobacteria bacterium]|jgi:type IV secretory pathway component VirB8|nr:type IV secretion system protein [Alphaproteobacteria bacterium]